MTRASRPLHILVVMRHGGYLRNYESLLRELSRRGHRLSIGFEARKGKLPRELEILERLKGEPAPPRDVRLPDLNGSRAHRVSSGARLALDYLRYLEPEFRTAEPLRERALQFVPAILRPLLAPGLLRRHRPRAAVQALLRAVERRIPPPPAIEDFLRSSAPDVVLVTPLVQFGGAQTDYLRAAGRLGIHSGLLVASWDNLTNKGLIHHAPDLVAVWNDQQLREAVELHDVPADHVVITGANAYDHWFGWSPQRDRAAFCAEIGVPAGRLLVLYVSSSPFIAQDELPFVQRWLEALRSASEPALRDAAVLVRPHPLDGARWQNAGLGRYGHVVVWPPSGANPTDDESRSAFFDSMYHAAAVVGLNTSAMIESAIVDRPVLTVLDPSFARTQEGTLHFHYLPRENGGPLLVARSLEQHVDQLAESVSGDGHRAANRRFLEQFIRPHGPAAAATPKLVSAIEDLAR